MDCQEHDASHGAIASPFTATRTVAVSSWTKRKSETERADVRLFNVPCGCEARKEIMFTRGNLGVPEAAILATVAIVLTLSFKKGRINV